MNVRIVALGALLLAGGPARADDLFTRLAMMSISLSYDVTVDDATRTMHIVGGIGPGLGDRVSRALEDHTIDTVTIESDGGLIADALATADAIERQGNLTVIARRSCVSACLPILLAGHTRLADADLTLQFHDVTLVPPLPAGAPTPPVVTRYYTFLDGHGAPRQVLDKMRAIGPARLFPVPAIDLVQSGALTAVLDGDRRVELPLAKWLFVERSRQIIEHDPSFGVLLTAIRSGDPDAVGRLADPMYRALTAPVSLAPSSVMHAEADRLRVQAMDSVDPVLAVADLRAVQRQAEALRRLRYWRTCEQLVLRIGDPVFQAAAPDTIAAENGSLAVMIAAAAATQWVARPMPPDAEEIARHAAEETRRRLASDGVRAEATDPQSVCLTHVRLNDVLLALDPAEAVAAARWLDHNRWPGPGRPRA